MQLSNLSLAVELFRAMDPEMPLQTVMTYLVVAARDPRPVLMSDLAKKLGIAHSSVTRNVQALSGTNRHGRRGHGLLHTWVDDKDRRVKWVELTPQGRRTRSLIEALGG